MNHATSEAIRLLKNDLKELDKKEQALRQEESDNTKNLEKDLASLKKKLQTQINKYHAEQLKLIEEIYKLAPETVNQAQILHDEIIELCKQYPLFYAQLVKEGVITPPADVPTNQEAAQSLPESEVAPAVEKATPQAQKSPSTKQGQEEPVKKEVPQQQGEPEGQEAPLPGKVDETPLASAAPQSPPSEIPAAASTPVEVDSNQEIQQNLPQEAPSTKQEQEEPVKKEVPQAQEVATQSQPPELPTAQINEAPASNQASPSIEETRQQDAGQQSTQSHDESGDDEHENLAKEEQEIEPNLSQDQEHTTSTSQQSSSEEENHSPPPSKNEREDFSDNSSDESDNSSESNLTEDEENQLLDRLYDEVQEKLINRETVHSIDSIARIIKPEDFPFTSKIAKEKLDVEMEYAVKDLKEEAQSVADEYSDVIQKLMEHFHDLLFENAHDTNKLVAPSHEQIKDELNHILEDINETSDDLTMALLISASKTEFRTQAEAIQAIVPSLENNMSVNEIVTRLSETHKFMSGNLKYLVEETAKTLGIAIN